MVESRCGLICSQCDYREKMNCVGCANMDKPFWGDSCPVKDCCEKQGHDHCGQCPDFPCGLLNEFAYDKEQGDNGKRIETCRMWASYPGINICGITADEVIAVLESEKTLILSTSAQNRVTIRTMSHVNDGLTVYFQSGSNYLKCQQISVNPNVAISVGGYDIEGKATLLSHPLDERNKLFAKLYKEKHTQSSNMWSEKPDEIVVKVEIGLVKQWRYVNGKPFIAVGQFAAAKGH